MPEVQPVILGQLVVETTDLEITKSVGDPPVNIVSSTDPFDVALTFQGQPGLPVWEFLKNINQQFRIRYFAESIGPGTNDGSLGQRVGNLTVGRDIYTGPQTTFTVPPNTLQPGVYRLACQISFPPFPGMAGFFEGTLLEVI